MLAIVFMTENTAFIPPFVPKSRWDFDDDYEYRGYKYDNLASIKAILTPEMQSAVADFQFAKTLTIKPTQNPTDLTNPYWQWLVRYDLSADDIGEIFGLDTYEISPLWCAERMGQSCTVLPNGRQILIGGEWEDGYDPQFAIYNDIIVKHPDGKIEIFGYPRHIFAPTDFHTATLVGDEIWIIGSIGYGEDRDTTQTSVYKLNIHTYKIEKVETRNSMGWVFKHSATLKDNQIIVTGGEIWLGDDLPMVENIDDWALNLKTLIWKNISKKDWQVFYVERKDRKRLHLWEIGSLEWDKKHNVERYQERLGKLEQQLGQAVDFVTYQMLFAPPIDHSVDENEQNYNTTTIFIDDVKVRYVDKGWNVQVYIEGKLPPHKVELLQENLRHKLSKLENFPCEVKALVF